MFEFEHKPTESSMPKASKRKADEASFSPLENTESSLDGVDPSHFKRAKRNVEANQTKPPSEQDRNDVEMSSGGDITLVEEEEKCRLQSFFEKLREDWPECVIGGGFDYYYRRTPCISFPNCKFADRCVYSHPNCELDALCTRKDCPFTHASKRALQNLPSRPPMKPKENLPGTRKFCRFFPNCRNVQCSYYHPEPCRYGNLCRKRGCRFGHSPAVHSPAQFRWTAPKL